MFDSRIVKASNAVREEGTGSATSCSVHWRQLGEIVQIDDTADIDFRAAEVRIVTLKRRDVNPNALSPSQTRSFRRLRRSWRQSPLCEPNFAVDPNNFRKIFYARALDAEFSKSPFTFHWTKVHTPAPTYTSAHEGY
jgi:hypothetical protein